MEQTKEEKTIVKEEEPLGVEKKGFNMKILIIGIPLFLVQLVAVYFITANILLSKLEANHSAEQEPAVENVDTAKVEPEPEAERGKFVYMVEDLIINPANTDGKRLLLSSLGFDVSTEKEHKALKAKDVLLKDAIISVMGSKELAQLGNTAYRDTLRIEITKRLSYVMPDVKINTIYFSKYILQ